MTSRADAKPLQRLFIANRGEIARRIALTAKRLGIETVALTDRGVAPAYLVGIVTHFVHVDQEAPPLYLNSAKMLEYARTSGCDSLHPGFGFLSESAEFAAATIAAGLTWVGPKPAAIEAMASKAAARSHAEKAGVPCVRGLSGFSVPSSASGDFTALEAFAGQVGYPLLLKAAYGGGGKGMRVVHELGELREAALRAQSEALNAFGNGSLICEQYLGAPRHIEVQILADQHGHVTAIGDRDCSLQRRHQKIIEEAPAIGLTSTTRRALHEAAVRLAAAVSYDSTGTVEFLLDWSDASRTAERQRFYFLEMNTRLQVEHPVSEEVYGLDLVEWQLRVAQGEALPADFAHLTPRGHSVEVRIYAEDVQQSFFPAPGPVAAFEPALGPGLRWELGLDPVDEVTGRFDPMIAKLIATGATRQVALARLADGLERTFFAGPANNLEFLRVLVTTSAFAEAPVTTHFLSEQLASVLNSLAEERAKVAPLGEELLALLVAGKLAAGASVKGMDVQALTQAIFRDAPMPTAPRVGAVGSPQLMLNSDHGFNQHILGGRGRAESGRGVVATAAGGCAAFAYAILTSSSERHFWLSVAGWSYQQRLSTAARRGQSEQQTAAVSSVVAPVPGRVIAVKVQPEAQVAAGQTMFVLESMKMEFEVKAATAGQIAAVSVSQNDQVTAGQLLAKWAQ